jgi:hypothetical protein
MEERGMNNDTITGGSNAVATMMRSKSPWKRAVGMAIAIVTGAAVAALYLAGCTTATLRQGLDLAAELRAEWKAVERTLTPETEELPTPGRHLAACGTGEWSGGCAAGCPLMPQPGDAPKPEQPAAPKPPPDPARASAYRSGFLWKPVAESGGRLVVLLPPAFAGHVVGECELWRYGDRLEASKLHAVANGGRPHYRFSKPGAGYVHGGDPITVAAHVRTPSGGIAYWRWRVYSPAGRVLDVAPTAEVLP